MSPNPYEAPREAGEPRPPEPPNERLEFGLSIVGWTLMALLALFTVWLFGSLLFVSV